MEKITSTLQILLFYCSLAKWEHFETLLTNTFAINTVKLWSCLMYVNPYNVSTDSIEMTIYCCRLNECYLEYVYSFYI